MTTAGFFKIHDRLPDHPELGGMTTTDFADFMRSLSQGIIPTPLHSDGAFRDRDGMWIALRAPKDPRPVALIRPPGWKPSRRKLPTRLRLLVLERDGRVCAYCGVTDDLQIDHIYPVSLGGTDDPTNLQVLCGDCNRRKSARVEN